MKVTLTMNELKCLALQQLGLQVELKRRNGLIMLQTPHEIEVINGDGAVEESSGGPEKGTQ